MSELRYILLGIGAVLFAGLWWWEQRRNRPTRDFRDSRPADRQEPRLDSVPIDDELPSHGLSGDLGFEEHDEPQFTARPLSDARIDPGAPPPVITIDDLPEDVESVELLDYYVDPSERTQPSALEAEIRLEDTASSIAPQSPAASASPYAEVLRPTQAARETEPVSAAPAPAAAPSAAAETPVEQRIIAIRMAAGRVPAGGRALLASLRAEGLEYGRYAIFHRQREDGRMLFSVASLLEPGSFDLEQMPTQLFPGVSLFAVFPGPVEATVVFDDMLATARRLADRLGGTLQDERGQALTAQRILSLREELVHFQSMVANIRARTAS